MQLPTKLLYSIVKASHHWVIYHLHYKEKSEIIKSAYKPFFLWLLPKLIEFAHNYFLFWLLKKLLSLFGVSSHYIIKVINPLYNMPDINKYWFAIYHLYYKKKQVNNPNWTLIYAANNFYFLFNFNNLSAAFFFFASNCRICTT